MKHEVFERTRDLDGAHVDFLSRVRNPIGVKIGPTASPDEVAQLCEVLNPEHVPGRLTLITRMGAGKVADVLPSIVQKVDSSGVPVATSTISASTNAANSASSLAMGTTTAKSNVRR